MKLLRSKAQFPSMVMVVIMVTFIIPCQSVSAALISTENVAELARGQEARDQLQQLFARDDVQAALIAQGLDPEEASNRIDVLTDEEVIIIADQVNDLPAGGSTLLIVGAAILVVTIIFYAIILLAVEATE